MSHCNMEFLFLLLSFSFSAKKDAIGIYTPERPYTMYVGGIGEKKIWLQNLQETIRSNLYGHNDKENTETGLELNFL